MVVGDDAGPGSVTALWDRLHEAIHNGSRCRMELSDCTAESSDCWWRTREAMHGVSIWLDALAGQCVGFDGMNMSWSFTVLADAVKKEVTK